jgi:hypothetical protein
MILLYLQVQDQITAGQEPQLKKLDDLALEAGFDEEVTEANHDEAIQALLRHHCIYTRYAQIEQFEVYIYQHTIKKGL